MKRAIQPFAEWSEKRCESDGDDVPLEFDFNFDGPTTAVITSPTVGQLRALAALLPEAP